MLKFLSIQNVVLIDKCEIDFSENSQGLCILTGETGSGKSILLDAFGLAIGFRSNLRLIGNDSDKSIVSAVFDISKNKICKEILQENNLLDENNPDELRIRRILQEKSSSKAFINDQTIGINLLAQIGETLVEIHGQHDSRGLLNPIFHEKILDEFAQNENILKKINIIYEELRITNQKIADLATKKEQAKREQDYLQYIVRELETANIQPNEEEDLMAKKNHLTGKEKILDFLNDFKTNLIESNSNLISAQKILIRNKNTINNFLRDKQSDFEAINDEIDNQNITLEKIIEEVENIRKNLNSGEENLQEIEERLFEIKTLARKFNVSSNELPKIIQDAQEKLRILENESQFTDTLNNKKEELTKEFNKIANEIHEKRKKSAIILAKKVEDELKFLKMENVKFLVDIKKTENFGSSGFDKVKFLAAINNNNFDEIIKIASGGELSRFMLALKVALMEIKSTPTIIFDEIDTGIGGMTADAVGKRLKILADNLQIFVVTHQPQIAAKANLHFRISKKKVTNKIKTFVEKLNEESKNSEIARMISGEEISKESLAAAKILLKK
ncbi:MAG TPA: DNA repair protein RecN [Rickettsiales bacterium]|nr:DNA repair protein RecN [Rickettsiales bacterium]